MRVIVIGAGGMLGAALISYLKNDPDIFVMGTVRGRREEDGIINNFSMIQGDDKAKRLAKLKPDVIINCICLKGKPVSLCDLKAMKYVNHLFPHELASLAVEIGARVIHFSSDGVFSGNGKGGYRECSKPDPKDYYGYTKMLGELRYSHCLTLRTSVIGHANQGGRQLLDWLLMQSGKVPGYKNVIFSGLPTIEIASIVHSILLRRNDINGVWNLGGGAISKFELLNMIVKRYGLNVEVVPVLTPEVNRSLDSSGFSRLTGYVAPCWKVLIDKMYHSYDRKN